MSQTSESQAQEVQRRICISSHLLVLIDVVVNLFVFAISLVFSSAGATGRERLTSRTERGFSSVSSLSTSSTLPSSMSSPINQYLQRLFIIIVLLLIISTKMNNFCAQSENVSTSQNFSPMDIMRILSLTCSKAFPLDFSPSSQSRPRRCLLPPMSPVAPPSHS